MGRANCARREEFLKRHTFYAEEEADAPDAKGPKGLPRDKRQKKKKAPKAPKGPRKPAPSSPAQVISEGASVLGARAGLSDLGIWIATLLCLPDVFYNILIVIFNSVGADSMEIFCLETFAGAGKMAREFLKHDKRALTFEKYGSDYGKADRHQDLCFSEGMIRALVWMQHMVLSALLWEGTVCSTWIVLARGSTKRTDTNPLGQEKYPCVKHANLMVARSALLMAFAMIKMLCFCLEQPHSSLLAKHPLMQWVAARSMLLPGANFLEVNTYMGAFGGPRPKRSNLYSNRPWLHKLERDIAGKLFPSCEDDGIVEKLPDGRMKGGSNLKQTQVYPDEFAEEFYKEWSKAEPAYTKELENKWLKKPFKTNKTKTTEQPQWEAMCELEKMLRFLLRKSD